MKPSRKRLVVVLGMHRSGTSVLARALNVLGVDIGNRLIPGADGVNTKGFFEDIDINLLNVEMLRRLGSDWHCVAAIDQGDLNVLREGGYVLRATALLRKKTANAPLFGFKDPRVAKLLPFWRDVFSRCKFDTRYILIVRNPLSVVQSLMKRDGIPAEKSHLLWLGHVLCSLLHSQGQKRVLLDYDHFLASPQVDLTLVSKRLGLTIDAHAFRNYESDFLEDDLRHTTFQPSDLSLDPACPPMVREVYAELLNASRNSDYLDDPAFHARVVLWANEFDRFNSNLRWIDSLNQSIDRHSAANTELILSVIREDPNALRQSFNSEWYMAKYPDVAAAGFEPYHHYISAGAKEGRLPSSDVVTFLNHALSARLRLLNGELADTKSLIQSRSLEIAEKEARTLKELQEIQRLHELQRDELRRNIAANENAHSAQLEGMRRQIDGYVTQLSEYASTHSDHLRITARAYEQQIQELKRLHAQNERARVVQHEDAQREIDRLLKELKAREETNTATFRLIEHAHEQRISELSRRHADHEKATLIELNNARRAIEGYVKELTKREDDYAERLRLVEQSRNEQIQELDRYYAEREQKYAGQLSESHRVIEDYANRLSMQEETHRDQVRVIEQTHQRLAGEIGRQAADRERTTDALLRAKQDQLDDQALRLDQVLKIQAQTIAQLQVDVSALRATYSWRLTTPFRKIADLIGHGKSGPPTERSLEEIEVLREDEKIKQLDHATLPWVPRDSAAKTGGAVCSQDRGTLEGASLDDLLSCEDVRFVRAAYETLLRRAPDPEGLRYYQARLRGGSPKIKLLEEIAASPEGIANNVKLPGLRELCILHSVWRLPIIGHLLLGSFFHRPKADPLLHRNRRTANFNDLLEFDDRKFVESVYLMFLARQPDPAGFNFYRDRLRSGIHKIQIIGEILESPEASEKGVDAWGWRAIVKLHELSRLRIVGRLFTTPTIAAANQHTQMQPMRDSIQLPSQEIIHPTRLDISPFKPNGRDSEENVSGLPRHVASDRGPPLISVVMPVYKTPIDILRCAVTSVVDQSFANWELCICDDGSRDPALREWLLDYALDDRIKVLILDENVGISAASNKAIELATGQFIAFLDHDDMLTFDALAEVAGLISSNRDVDVIYTDQDKIDETGAAFEPFYKPDWSPDYFRRVMYVGHLLVVRAGLVRESGGFRPQFNRVQDYEFLLRISEVASKIMHIPKVLYHWRAIQGSIAATPNAKGMIESLQCDAVREHLQRVGLKGDVLSHPNYAHRVLIRPIKGSECRKVSIIIPSKNRPEHIGRCLQSIFGLTSYKNYEVIVVDNGTTDKEALRILGEYPVKVVAFNEPFNYSKANNLGVANSTGDVIVLLNNDTEVITRDWLEILLNNLEQDDVGAVGSMLLYPDMTVQHAGIVLGPRGTADHVMRSFPWQSDGYAGSLSCVREVSGVTGACLMTRKETYTSVGGLVEHFGTHYQDVDYCLRIRSQGKRILHVPDTQIIHYESATRGKDYDLLDRLLLQDTWARELSRGDPYFNPAFSLTTLDYSLNSAGKDN